MFGELRTIIIRNGNTLAGDAAGLVAMVVMLLTALSLPSLF